MGFFWAVCGMHSRMCLSPRCVLSVGLSDLFMAVFPGFYLTCFWVCASGSVICILFVGSPQIWGLWFVCRCLLQDAMFMNGLWVVFSRILCLWSVWGCVLGCEVSDVSVHISQHVKSVNILKSVNYMSQDVITLTSSCILSSFWGLWFASCC